MKKIILSSMLLVFASAQAEILPVSRPGSRVLGTVLFNIQEGDQTLRTRKISRLNINPKKNTISLEMVRTFRCGPMTRCLGMLPQKYEVVLPLISTETDGCGSVTYLAEKDQRPVDGAHQSIKVVDHALNMCSFVLHSDLVQVEYLTENLQGDVQTKNMVGTQLIQGGVANYSALMEQTCRLSAENVDNALDVDVMEIIGTTFKGESVNLGKLASVTETGLPGTMFFKYFAVTETVSDEPGAGSTYNDMNGEFEMRLPLTGLTSHSRPAFLDVMSDEKIIQNESLTCRRSR
jgi:hypothetical protein